MSSATPCETVSLVSTKPQDGLRHFPRPKTLFSDQLGGFPTACSHFLKLAIKEKYEFRSIQE